MATPTTDNSLPCYKKYSPSRTATSLYTERLFPHRPTGGGIVWWPRGRGEEGGGRNSLVVMYGIDVSIQHSTALRQGSPACAEAAPFNQRMTVLCTMFSYTAEVTTRTRKSVSSIMNGGQVTLPAIQTCAASPWRPTRTEPLDKVGDSGLASLRASHPRAGTRV